MVRALVLLLLLLNAAYFAWTRNLLRPYGFAPVQQAETFRLAQQIRPESVRILSVEEARRAEATAQNTNRPVDCLQAGPFNDTQTEVLRQAAESVLPPGSWLFDATIEPARWIVYMGKYPDPQTLAKKRSELASLNLRFEPLTNRSLDYGLSLGGFDTEARAQVELANLGQRGVRTAAVVQERPESRGTVFRIPAVNEAVKARLDELKTALAGDTLRACK